MPNPTSLLVHYPFPSTSKRSVWPRIVVVLLVVGALLLAFYAAMFVGITHVFKSSSAYRASLDFATHAPAVVEALGSPIEDGPLPVGRFETDSAGGNARFSISL